MNSSETNGAIAFLKNTHSNTQSTSIVVILVRLRFWRLVSPENRWAELLFCKIKSSACLVDWLTVHRINRVFLPEQKKIMWGCECIQQNCMPDYRSCSVTHMMEINNRLSYFTEAWLWSLTSFAKWVIIYFDVKRGPVFFHDLCVYHHFRILTLYLVPVSFSLNLLCFKMESVTNTTTLAS